MGMDFYSKRKIKMSRTEGYISIKILSVAVHVCM